MYNEDELSQALQNAHNAGDTQAAQHLASVINQQRDQFVAEQGLQDRTMVDELGIAGVLKFAGKSENDWSAADDMSQMDKFQVGMGKGFTDIGQGAMQLLQRGGNSKLPEHLQYDTEKLDNQIQQENQQFSKDLGDSNFASVGRFAGQTVGTAPIGGAVGMLAKPVMGASRLANAANMAKQGALVGATEASLMPTSGGGDFWSEKAAQTGMGAGFGGVLGGGIGAAKGVNELAKDSVGATVHNALNKGTTNKIGRAFIGDTAEKAEREALSLRTGVPLTPAELSGSRLGAGLESLAEQSLITADDVLEKSTMPGLNKLKDYALRQADTIGKSKKSVAQVGRNLQGLTKKITTNLVKTRSETGRKLYGEIDNLARGQKIVKNNNLNQVFDDIINDTNGLIGADSAAIAREVKILKASLNPTPKAQPYSYNQGYGAKQATQAIDDGMTAGHALRQLQAWSTSKSGKLFKDIDDYGVNQHYKQKLSEALLTDMDNVGGALGEKVKLANTAWRKGSQEIDSLEASILGQVTGKELSSELNGFITNTVAPEKVIAKFRSAAPEEVKAAMVYINKFDPAMAKEFKSNFIRMAVEEAQTGANSSGAQKILNPTQLLNSLGIKSSKAGVEGLEKLRAIFGDAPNGKQFITDVIELSRIKADAFGRNFSGTAVQNEANKLLSSIGQFATGFMNMGKQALGTVGHIAGIKSVAKTMIDKAPFKATIGSMGKPVNAGGYLSGAATPAFMNQVNDNENR